MSRRGYRRRKSTSRARARARRHRWTRTASGARMKSGIFLARVWKKHGHVLFQVTATGFQRSGIERTLEQAKKKAAASIARAHRALAADVMKAR